MRSIAVALLLADFAASAHAQSSELTREFQAGVDAFRLGQLDEAKAHLEKAKALDPKLPGPHRFLAAVARAQSRWQACIDSARTAIELNPRSQEIDDTRRLHDACRASAGKPAYTGELGDSAAIAVVTSASGATVKIGGLNYGGTPLAPRPITAGPLELEVEKAGWKPAKLTVNALPGIVTDVTIELEPDPTARTTPDLPLEPEASMAWLVVQTPGNVWIDGAKTAPTDQRYAIATGTRLVEVRQESKDPWRRRVRVSAGQKLTIAPELVDTAARERTEKIGVALLGGGAAIAVFGFIASLRSTDAASEAREIDRLESSRPPAGRYTRADFDAAHDRAQRWSLISSIAFGTGLVTVGTGAVFMYLGGRERDDVPPPFYVAPLAGGAMVSREVSW